MIRSTGNLPAEVSSLVGRRAESAEIKRALSSSRLVTLTGPGGAGKTRLALHIGRGARSAFPDGVWVASLAELSQPDLLPSTVSSCLALPGGNELGESIGDRRLLLVLDNCEHLAQACATLTTAILQDCPNVKVLATSQEPLRVEGETIFVVPPLSLPHPGSPLQPGVDSTYDAVALFLERAAAANPGLSLDEGERQLVVELCRRLDGMPLAIELAAAGTRTLPLSALAASAERPHELLVSGSRTAPPRHHTLRATLDYSYERCSTPAQRLWGCMSVFRGGADLIAIETVCAHGELTPDTVRWALGDLVDKSIVTFDGRRYRMLEMIRSYGDEHLRASGGDHDLRVSHLEWLSGLAGQVDAGWFGPDQPALLTQVLAEQANLRAAFEFCLARPTSDVGAGLRMAAVLWPFWVGCGLLTEGRHWLDRFLAAPSEPSRDRLAALWVNGLLTAASGDVRGGLALLDDSQVLARGMGDEAGRAHALQMVGLAELLDGRTRDAVIHLDAAAKLERRQSGFNPYLPFALVNLGAALCYDEHVDRAVQALTEARSMCIDRGEQLLHSWSLVYLGMAAILDKRVVDAVPLLSEGLSLKRALGDRLGMTYALELLGWAAYAEGDLQRAARLLGASEAMAEPLGTHLAGLHRMVEWHTDYTTRAREALGARRFDAAHQSGRQLTDEERIAYALGGRTARKAEPRDRLTDLPLTPRELEIAKLVASGKTNKEIADELVVAHRTVSTHVEHILAKLNFRSRTQIARLMAAEGRDID